MRVMIDKNSSVQRPSHALGRSSVGGGHGLHAREPVFETQCTQKEATNSIQTRSWFGIFSYHPQGF